MRATISGRLMATASSKQAGADRDSESPYQSLSTFSRGARIDGGVTIYGFQAGKVAAQLRFRKANPELTCGFEGCWEARCAEMTRFAREAVKKMAAGNGGDKL